MPKSVHAALQEIIRLEEPSSNQPHEIHAVLREITGLEGPPPDHPYRLHPALRELGRLEGPPSLDYPDQLKGVLRGPSYLHSNEELEKLGEYDKRLLVEYLDEALGHLDTSNPLSRKCLRDLKSCCRIYKILPSSHTDVSSRLTLDSYATGGGGSSDIYGGDLDGSRVCVKRFRIHSGKDLEETIKKSYGHAAIWKHLNHPNILPLLNIVTTAGFPVQFVSRWIPEATLLEYIEKNPNANRLNILLGIAKGLNYLHSREVIHGDLKGPNILVDGDHESPNVYLADFDATAVTMNTASRRLHTAQYSLSAQWSSPEVLGGGEPTREADVFSFAMVMIEVFTGGTPFGDKPEYVTATAVTEGKRPSRPENPLCTDDLWSLIGRCWEPKSSSRPGISDALEILNRAPPPRN